MDAEEVWPAEWLRGALELCVLRVVAEAPSYGYAIATRLEESGLGAVKGGTLYPLLGRLDAAGIVAVEWRAGESGPGRKYYALTEVGRAELDAGAARWADFARLTTSLIVPDDAGGGREGEAAQERDAGVGDRDATTRPMEETRP